MKIAKFVKTNTTEWDDITCCIVYIEGCNFRCGFCNQTDCFETENPIPEYQVLDQIRNSEHIEGVIISGGEPCASPNLYLFLKEIKKMGKKIKIETNGSYPDNLDDLIGAKMVDFVSLEIKAPFQSEDYSTITNTNIDVEIIKRSVSIVMDSGVDYEIKITIVPIQITEQKFESICKSIKGCHCICINQFKSGNCYDQTLNSIQPYKEKTIREMEKIAKKYAKKVKIKGV